MIKEDKGWLIRQWELKEGKYRYTDEWIRND